MASGDGNERRGALAYRRQVPLPPSAHGEQAVAPAVRRTLYEAYLGVKPLLILLAEDDREMRRLLALALERDGHEIIEAQDGEELQRHLGELLLETPSARPPNLIISDVRMPGRTGLEVLATLRDAPGAPPFIVITAFGDAATHARARRLGAVAVFDKPFRIDDLRTAVAHFASRAP